MAPAREGMMHDCISQDCFLINWHRTATQFCDMLTNCGLPEGLKIAKILYERYFTMCSKLLSVAGINRCVFATPIIVRWFAEQIIYY